MDGAERSRHWKAWKSHTEAHGLDLYLRTSDSRDKTDALLTFAVTIRRGKYGKKRKVRVQSVEKALRHVGQRFVLDRYPDPRRQFATGKDLDLPIARLIKKYRDEDPPAEQKLAIPVSTIETIATKYTFSAYHQAVADLIIIAFFFLLRIGEYTVPSRKDRDKKRTVELRSKDITLWFND